MLFLLLGLLTSPTPALPAVTVVADRAMVEQHRPAAVSLADARAYMTVIEAGPRKIQALMRNAQDTQYHAGCVAQRLGEAQVHVTLARDEMKVLDAGPAPSEGQLDRAGNRAHALKRLSLLAQRTAEVEKAARLCIEDELSTISATKFEVEVSPAVKATGDVTQPPPPDLFPEPRPPKP